MSIFAISALINVATSSVVGTIVFFSNLKNKANKVFALFAAAIAAWSLCYYFWQISITAETALFWSRGLMYGAILIPFFYFHFTTIFIKKYRSYKILVWIGYFLALVFLVANYFELIVSGVENKSALGFHFEFWPTPGVLMIPFLIIWVFYAFFAAILLWKKYKTSNRGDSHYVLLMFVGIFIGYIGGCMNFLLWYDIPVPPLGNISASIFVAFVAYGIMRYRLFNIRLVAAQLLVFVLWLSLFIRLLVTVDPQEQIFNATLLVASLLIGFLLMRSIDKEVATREEISKLATELAGANMHLERLDKVKSEFVSIASHQLRSPITSIRGYISMINEGSYGEVNPKIKEILENVSESARYMSLSIDDYLNVSRIEAGNMKYELSDCDVSEIVKKIVSEMLPISLKKGMTLIFRPQFDGKALVKLDIGKAKQIIQNLTDNALKYTQEGGIVTITLRKDVKVKKVYIDITDNGIGMNEEALADLFNKFQRASNANSVNVIGTGLGLYIAREMARGMDGEITASSKGEGHGSTFTIEFPLNGIDSSWSSTKN